jgi:hypothetical protein
MTIMLRPASCLALLVVLPLASACAAGGDDGLTGLSGAYSVGPADEGGTASETGGSTGESAEGPLGTSSSADGTGDGSGGDVGNPLCCEVGAQAGCDSMVTEACVCTSQPSCCQNVWAQTCVDLAIACGDPYCTDAPATDDGGSTDTGVELECDPDFEFSPANPAPGVAFTATFTDPVGLTWVGMHASGPGGATVEGGNLQISDDGPGGPFHWSYDFAGLAAGVWTFEFTYREAENGADIVAGTCDKQF